MEIVELSRRVEKLDKDVQYLRIEFDDRKRTKELSDEELLRKIERLDMKFEGHLKREEEQHCLLNMNVADIKKNLQILVEETRPAVTLTNTAHYIKVAVDFCKNVIVPIIAGGALVAAYFMDKLPGIN